MKIPQSAFPQMIDMVMKSLPFETPFEPVTPEASALLRIFDAVAEQDSTLKGLSGFIYFMSKKIDGSKPKQASLYELYLTLDIILQDYHNQIK